MLRSWLRMFGSGFKEFRDSVELQRNEPPPPQVLPAEDTGVREPRRPRPVSGSDTVRLPEPS